ncbi:MAG: hypothetical protein IJK71_03425 [Clostridia bacterium]|nr:hypothetical protein [Clostridia bacterium]
MKRLCVYLLLGVILLFPFYAAIGEEALPGQWFITNTKTMVETTEGYYISYDGFVFFCDKESFETKLVCARHNCLHQNEMHLSDCDAYIDGFGITVISDRIYYQGFDTIGRMQMDGTGHEEWIPAPWDRNTQQEEYGFQGKYYFYVNEYIDSVENTILQMKDFFYAIDVSDRDNQKVLIEEWDGLEKAIIPLQVSDDSLYYMTGAMNGDINLWRFDLKTQKRTQLYCTQEKGMYYCKGDKAYILQVNQGVSLLDLNTKEKRVLVTGDQTNPYYTQYYCDGRYIYSMTTNTDNFSCDMILYNLEGEELAHTEIPSASYLYLIGQDHLIFGGIEAPDVPHVAVPLNSLLQGEPVFRTINVPELFAYD